MVLEVIILKWRFFTKLLYEIVVFIYRNLVLWRINTISCQTVLQRQLRPGKSYCLKYLFVMVFQPTLANKAIRVAGRLTLWGRNKMADILLTICSNTFFNIDIWIPINISVKFAPGVPINNIPALVSIMAWQGPGDKLLSQLMMASLLTYLSTRGLRELKGA